MLFLSLIAQFFQDKDRIFGGEKLQKKQETIISPTCPVIPIYPDSYPYQKTFHTQTLTGDSFNYSFAIIITILLGIFIPPLRLLFVIFFLILVIYVLIYRAIVRRRKK